mgnify:CR=1 FL=1
MSAGWVNYLTHPWVNFMIGDRCQTEWSLWTKLGLVKCPSELGTVEGSSRRIQT